MEKKGYRLEHYGYLSKTENVTTLSTNIVPGTLVLEAPEPFPGSLSFYSEAPHLSKPLYVYLVLEGSPDLEQFATATETVQQKLPYEFNAAYASIEVNREKYDTIRIRHLMQFNQIEEVQKAYMRENIQMKKFIHPLSGAARITLKKLFQLWAFPNNLYLDFEEKDQGYFQIQEKLSVIDFNALIHSVKNNTYLLNYDFAQAFFYTNNHIVHVIRAFYPEMSLELLSEIKNAVLARFKSHLHTV